MTWPSSSSVTLWDIIKSVHVYVLRNACLCACGVYRKSLIPNLQSQNLTCIVLLNTQTWTLKASSQPPLHVVDLGYDGGIGRICWWSPNYRREHCFQHPLFPMWLPELTIPGTAEKCFLSFTQQLSIHWILNKLMSCTFSPCQFGIAYPWTPKLSIDFKPCCTHRRPQHTLGHEQPIGCAL